MKSRFYPGPPVHGQEAENPFVFVDFVQKTIYHHSKQDEVSVLL